MTNIADHWWWRPGWGPGTRFYTFHFTFQDQPVVREHAAQAYASAGFGTRERALGMVGSAGTCWYDRHGDTVRAVHMSGHPDGGTGSGFNDPVV